ncbi:MAG: hypothetical protein ACREYE_28230 [Gammaproteobacteria bacterium]
MPTPAACVERILVRGRRTPAATPYLEVRSFELEYVNALWHLDS